MNQSWNKCKPGLFRQVNFALGTATVRLLSSLVYRGIECSGGRVYHVEDVVTGQRDFVGKKYLKRRVQ